MEHQQQRLSPAHPVRPRSAPAQQSVSTVFPAEVPYFSLADDVGRLPGQSHSASPGPSAPTSSSSVPAGRPLDSSSIPEPIRKRQQLPKSAPPTNAHSASNIIVIPPQEKVDQQQNSSESKVGEGQRPGKRHSKELGSPRRRSGCCGGRRDEGMIVALQQKLFEHYHNVAYGLVAISYFLAFCEYLYLRLDKFIHPEPRIYKKLCDAGQIVYRNEVHFASGMAVFLVMSVYQLVCFFLLTVSSRFMEVKRTYSHVLSMEERLHLELVFAVKRILFSTLYATFSIYVLSSSVIICAIFYMIGLRDPIVHAGSQVIVCLFDLAAVIYFLAFPVLCVLFHPDIDCRARMAQLCCGSGGGGRQRVESDRKSQSLQTNGGHRQQDAAKAVADPPVLAQTGQRGGTARRPAPQGPGTAHFVAEVGRQQSPAGGINYGSLEQRSKNNNSEASPRQQQKQGESEEATEGGPLGAAGKSEIATQTEAMRRRMKQRRQSRYRRLKGSDESAECRIGRTMMVMMPEEEIVPGRNAEGEMKGEESEEERERRRRRSRKRTAEQQRQMDDDTPGFRGEQGRTPNELHGSEPVTC